MSTNHFEGVLYCAGRIKIFIILFIVVSAPFILSAVALPADQRHIVLEAMKKELRRSHQKLSMENYETPYFISYSIRETETVDIVGKWGTIFSIDSTTERSVSVDVRVGQYDMDNTDVDADGYGLGGARVSGFLASMPIENDEIAIRNVLWYLTDLKYKSALENYLKKKGRRVFEVIGDTIPDFSREFPHIHHDPRISFQVDLHHWKNIVKAVSKYTGMIPEILESSVRFRGRKEVIYFVNTEGADIITERTYFTVHTDAMSKAPDGMPIENFRAYYSCNYDEMPGLDSILAESKLMIDELHALRDAEELQPYVGPAILSSEVTAVVFHEVIGHRLEGERQRKKDSGQTFRGKIGQEIIPDFLSVFDDPTLERWKNVTLFGHYKYDNEGIPARHVTLIDHGILKNYLMSRTPIKEIQQSNGHGRGDGSIYYGNPIGRMGVTVVKAEIETPYERLKELLLEECKKQNKPYGLLIRRVRGGETSTERWGYQAYKEYPILTYRIDVDTGKEILVRGVEIVGTPLTSINKIIAACGDYGVFNGYCGAESGYIPVTAIAPTVVTQEIELQKSSEQKSKPPLLPPPFLDYPAMIDFDK